MATGLASPENWTESDSVSGQRSKERCRAGIDGRGEIARGEIPVMTAGG